MSRTETNIFPYPEKNRQTLLGSHIFAMATTVASLLLEKETEAFLRQNDGDEKEEWEREWWRFGENEDDEGRKGLAMVPRVDNAIGFWKPRGSENQNTERDKGMFWKKQLSDPLYIYIIKKPFISISFFFWNIK